MSLSGSYSNRGKQLNEKGQDINQQTFSFPLESMTSRRPNSAVSNSSRASSTSRRRNQAPSPHLQPPPASEAQRQQDSQVASPGIAREDTPIIPSRGSTPRSYLSTTTGENATNGNGNGNGNGTSSREDEQNMRDGVATEPRQEPQHSPQQNYENYNGSLEDRHRPWYKKAVEKYGSLELENKGSVARDHLALERTFLAWLRTSLAFASIGIAITQLFRLNTSISSDSSSMSVSSSSASSGSLKAPTDTSHIAPILPPKDNSFFPAIAPHESTADFDRLRSLGKPLGATFIGIAIVVLLVGFHRYFESQYWVVRGKFPASRGSIAIVAFFTCGLMVTSLVVILAIAPGAFEA